MTHPFIPFTDVAKVEMCYTQSGQQTENVFHFLHTSGSMSPEDMGTLAAGMKNWWDTAMKSKVTDAIQLRLIRVKDLTSEYAPGIEYSTGLPITGTNLGGSLPTNVTVAVKWTTGLSGRSFRGRTFHAGLANTQVSGDNITAGTVSDLLTVYGNLISTPPTNWQLVVASQYNQGAWRVTGVATAVTAVSIENNIDSQRRRLVGRGR